MVRELILPSTTRATAHVPFVPPILDFTMSQTSNTMILNTWMYKNKRSVMYSGPSRTPGDSEHCQVWWCECIVDNRFTVRVGQFSSSQAAKEAAAGLAIDTLNFEGWSLARVWE
jgi:hypothetical protein